MSIFGGGGASALQASFLPAPALSQPNLHCCAMLYWPFTHANKC